MTFKLEPVTADQELEALAVWFAAALRTEPDYISHSEILWGRARNETSWSTDLEAVLKTEFSDSADNVTRIRARSENEIAGLACTRVVVEGHRSALILEDLYVDPRFRRQGLARLLLREVEHEAVRRGVDWIGLESGLRNTSAHDFFEAIGFTTVSKTMLKPVKAASDAE